MLLSKAPNITNKLSSSSLKFQYQSRKTTCIKLLLFCIVLISPLILFQIVISSANKQTRRFEEYELSRVEENLLAPVSYNYLQKNGTTMQASADDSIKTAKEIGLATGAPSDLIEPNIDQRQPTVVASGEIFDVHSNSFKEELVNQAEKSILRIRRDLFSPEKLADVSQKNLDENNNRHSTNDESRAQSGSASKPPRTMVLVSSKSGKFHQLLPLEELIVAPAEVVGEGVNSLASNDAIMNSESQNSPTRPNGSDEDGESEDDLERQNVVLMPLEESHKFQQQFEPAIVDQERQMNVESQNNGYKSEPRIGAIDTRQQEYQRKVEEAPADGEPQSLDQMPDSFEGIMGLGGGNLNGEQEADGATGESQAVLSDQQEPAVARASFEGGEDDEEDSEAPETRIGPLVPAELPNVNEKQQQQQAFERKPGQMNSFGSGGQEVGLSGVEDLNTAAGHHYKKKKRKKIVIRKKKKKVIKKKKKKVKKIKIVKYKKKKKKVIVKKKKKKHGKKMKHHKPDHGKYYMYAKVPKKKSWEFGFKKGNKKHWIERHEKGHKNKFKTKVKWYDKKSKGKGLHIWDYNHHDKKKKKHH